MINAAFKLQDSGFSREQVEALTAYWEGSLASKEDIADLRGEMVEIRGELKQDIAHLEGKIEAQGERLEGKIEATATELRGEMVEIRSELKQDIAEVKEDIARLEGKIQTTAVELRGEMKELRTELKYIRWIGAVIIVGVLIPLIRDFLL